MSLNLFAYNSLVKFSGLVLKTKLIATGIHLTMSLVVFAILAYLIYYYWYPQPYFSIDGGWQGIRLVAVVDLVLGPLLTFLIIDLTKKRREVVFDLGVLLAIQFSALTYGVMVTYEQRPLAVVFIDEFMLPATEEHYAGTLESFDALSEFSDEKPPIIFAGYPFTTEGVEEVNRIKRETGAHEHAQLHLYRPKDEFKPALKANQYVFVSRLEQAGLGEKFEAWLEQNQKTYEDVLVGQYTGRYGHAWLLFDAEGKYLTYL